MSLKEDHLQIGENTVNNERLCSNIKGENAVIYQAPRESTDEGSLPTCRVCQCFESDSAGDAALGYLNIFPPLQDLPIWDGNKNNNTKDDENGAIHARASGRKSGVIEFVSTEGEVFICTTDIEAGSYNHQDTIINLGCSCKNDLAQAHYACALKWFINHGSTVCEICGSLAQNIRLSDFKKIVTSLKDYESLRERTSNGDPTLATDNISDVDSNAVAAIRIQRLSDISLWFSPLTNNNNNTSTTVAHGGTGQNSTILIEDVLPPENPATKWAVEGTGIIVATGLLTVTLAWLIAPRIGKKKNGLHILLGGICALTVVLFLRFAIIIKIDRLLL
ncbi:RING/FYVE/PHD zinc finger superfamily protein [Thalictrum thalictroides]|uniref:RING/FYVE/PHD zinc finger superfamily protein n=1 Tax=Thalictrum thalictroides TaxID=46969 RepID=A0A7J6XFK2_THATH|nr:RING/FYVE/PHD zinc finger superfamily protein [Thalictrum thalictroides]